MKIKEFEVKLLLLHVEKGQLRFRLLLGTSRSFFSRIKLGGDPYRVDPELELENIDVGGEGEVWKILLPPDPRYRDKMEGGVAGWMDLHNQI